MISLREYNNLPENIKAEYFDLLLDNIIDNKNNISTSEILRMLEVLIEKYYYFYGKHILAENKKYELSLLLEKITVFSNFEITDSITSIMINFDLDGYYNYLKKHINTIISANIKQEVLDSINEFEISRN